MSRAAPMGTLRYAWPEETERVLVDLPSSCRQVFGFLFSHSREDNAWFSASRKKTAASARVSEAEFSDALEQLESAGLVLRALLPWQGLPRHGAPPRDVGVIIVADAPGVFPDWLSKTEHVLVYGKFSWRLGEAQRLDGTPVAKPRRERVKTEKKPSPSKTSVSDSVCLDEAAAASDPEAAFCSVSEPTPFRRACMWVVGLLPEWARQAIGEASQDWRERFHRALDDSWGKFEAGFGDRAVEVLEDRMRSGLPGDPAGLFSLDQAAEPSPRNSKPRSAARRCLSGDELDSRRDEMLEQLRRHERQKRDAEGRRSR